MADYFTNFSFIVPLPDEAAQRYALRLAAAAAEARDGEPLPTDFPAELAPVVEDWVFETEAESAPGKFGVWLQSSSGGIDAVCSFAQHLLGRFAGADTAVSFEWSHDCTKPRLDAFGGGAAVIAAARIKTMSTADWLHQQAARLARNNKQKGVTR